jgi:hypothetical protein
MNGLIVCFKVDFVPLVIRDYRQSKEIKHKFKKLGHVGLHLEQRLWRLCSLLFDYLW